jgi:hypothetical protein
MIPAPARWRFAFRYPVPAFAVLVAIAAALLFAPAAAAQEGDREEAHHVGAHDIRVVPVNLNLGAGSAQFAVFVTDPQTGGTVPDAKVVLVTSNSDDGNPGWAIATNSPALPERYDVHLKLDSTGEWDVSADVSSSLGADFVEVTTLDVPSVNRLTQGTWVFVGAFVMIMGGIGYVWWSARREYLRKRAAQTETP